VSIAPALQAGASAVLLLASAYWLSARVPLQTPLAWILHACASVALAVLCGAALQRSVGASAAMISRIAAAAGLYWLFIGVRWAHASLSGPETVPAEQLALDLVRAPTGAEQHRERFVVQRRGREIVVPAHDVNWIQAAGHDVVLHLGPESYRVRESMQAIEQSLDPRSFVRVHRSRIVNLDRIRAIYPWAYGDFRILMQDGSVVNFSRRYRSRLDELVG
jgi:DNA-binding LytR/AlgR family response regulator